MGEVEKLNPNSIFRLLLIQICCVHTQASDSLNISKWRTYYKRHVWWCLTCAIQHSKDVGKPVLFCIGVVRLALFKLQQCSLTGNFERVLKLSQWIFRGP